MLSTWCLNNKSTRKRLAWWGYQNQDLRSANCIHATSADEAKDIRSVGLDPPIAMIPHGCDMPPEELGQTDSPKRLAICITRIHPVKGLPELLDAWADVRPQGWQLVIAGHDSNGYASELRQQIVRHDLSDSVEITQAVDGLEKMELLGDRRRLHIRVA